MALTIYGTGLSASEEERTISGLLLPYNEVGKTSAGAVTASAGSVSIPEDVSQVTLNIEHDGLRPVGRATSIEEREDGLHATFHVAKTGAGNDLLEEVREGLRACLSVEVESPVIKAGHLISGDLTAAGAVVRPAFPSAAIYALTAADTGTTDTDAPAPDQAEAPVAADNLEGTESTVTDAVTPEALLAARTGAASEPTEKALTFAQFAKKMAAAHNEGDDAVEALFATISPQGASVFDDVRQDEWLGEVKITRDYKPKFGSVVSHRALTSRKAKGFKVTASPTGVAAYLGAPNEVAPLSAPTFEPVEVTAERLAVGWSLDRSYVDFGETEFINLFFRGADEDYARKIDTLTLTKITSSATSVTAVEPGAVTDGKVSAGAGRIVQGALHLLANDIVPDYALVSLDVFEDMLLQPKDNVFEWINQSLGLEGGSEAGLTIIPSAALTANSVIVGSVKAITLFELPGASPLRVDGVKVHNGAVDEALYGYYAFLYTGEGIVAVEPYDD